MFGAPWTAKSRASSLQKRRRTTGLQNRKPQVKEGAYLFLSTWRDARTSREIWKQKTRGKRVNGEHLGNLGSLCAVSPVAFCTAGAPSGSVSNGGAPGAPCHSIC